MLDNYKLIILGGGFHRCTPQWNKNRIESERYYKIYIPTQGSVKIETLEGEFSIVPSQLYFISGHRLKSQRCPRYMDVHWIHFTTESIYLNYLLDQTPSVQSWPLSETKWCLEDCENLSRSFPRFEGKHSPPYPNTPLSSHCRMQGLLLLVISRLLDKIEKKTIDQFQPQYYQFKPALDFMQERFKENPSLNEIAKKIHLAPEYFHRRFKALFKVTPFDFMLLQRLNQGRHLLASTSLTVKEISEQVGYENPLYFSRVFASKFGMSPTQYRLTHGEFF